jgi:hypothetical protein
MIHSSKYLVPIGWETNANGVSNIRGESSPTFVAAFEADRNSPATLVVSNGNYPGEGISPQLGIDSDSNPWLSRSWRPLATGPLRHLLLTDSMRSRLTPRRTVKRIPSTFSSFARGDYVMYMPAVRSLCTPCDPLSCTN